MSEAPYAIRHIEPGDVHFVVDSWLRSYQESKSIKGIERQLGYRTAHREVAAYLIASAEVAVCHARAEPSVILAWLCYSPDVTERGETLIHYAYSRPDVRRRGLVRDMISRHCGDPRRIVVTHIVPGRLRRKVVDLGWTIATNTPFYMYLCERISNENRTQGSAA